MKTKKTAKKPEKRGGYRMPRNQEGLTPKQRLDTAKAEAQEFENRRNREKWQTAEEAEAVCQETADIIQSDLYGTLPLSLAGKLSGKSFTPAQIRQIVRQEVDTLVKQWIKGERVPASSVPAERGKK